MRFLESISRQAVIGLSVVLLVISSFVASVAPAAAADYTVKMGADNGMLAFQPKTLTVKPGDTVDFVNNKLPPHNVIFADKSLTDELTKSGLLYQVGDDTKLTIPEGTEPGKYEYYCQPHRGAGMVGSLVVE
ncbi:MAG: plastocyanin [Microcoleaceae cyanobacterium]